MAEDEASEIAAAVYFLIAPLFYMPLVVGFAPGGATQPGKTPMALTPSHDHNLPYSLMFSQNAESKGCKDATSHHAVLYIKCKT
jgi:hypothetical protein